MKQVSPFLMLLFLVTSFTYSQTFKIDSANFDELIAQVYGERAQDLIYKDSKVLETYKSILNRLEIIKSSEEVKGDYQFLSTVPSYKPLNQVFSPKNFNPYNYKMDFFRKDETVYYVVDNTEYVILIKPLK
ncbi:hypothetical protein [Planktosalinus lacus]|uniref:DUF3887 domain-containing protein n=1 Tax=Planktosalinus lacus TaxID=1526573 RepID=A0A8J2YCH6_9FLAO|nr:hypothetical protein [Planktosalinus lacus]GGE01214.1 hypothetical protein GCM10011312_25850 [Planktosalinus lacus]